MTIYSHRYVHNLVVDIYMNDTVQSRLGPPLMDSVLVLRLFYYHHGAVRMMRTVVTHASKNSPFNCSIAMASDNQHLRLMPLNRLTKNIPGIPFQHFKQSIDHLGAELPGLLDDAHGALLQVRLHERQHIRGAYRRGRRRRRRWAWR
ncbi:Os12g0552550 [Oryza sativa Japonica Group]|uniref:Os12g0552550 protein n=1 Tax=Oryza sativa subsp. japonica TaxID=39947 RepID=A0A0P0YBD0_ORYSJ|nr:hypothetical protein EE612_060160 [Oryza sativa]BAT17577.1 Os12g0552550 [Oryza sativa Japonica Group]